jgi:hypothetical protein
MGFSSPMRKDKDGTKVGECGVIDMERDDRNEDENDNVLLGALTNSPRRPQCVL